MPRGLGEVQVVLELGRQRAQLLLLDGDARALGLADAPRLFLEALAQQVRLLVAGDVGEIKVRCRGDIGEV